MLRTAIILTLALTALGAAEPPATLALSAGGKPVAATSLPAGWKTAVAGEKITIIPAQGRPHIQVWPVAARTVAEAETGLDALIVSEVKEFKPTAKTDLTVAGKPARQLSGTGVEADDGDPGNAEVTLFSIGTQVFVLVSHGEGPGVADRHDDLAKLLAAIVAR